MNNAKINPNAKKSRSRAIPGHKDVRPISSNYDLANLLDSLQHDFRLGQRNYTIFQVGKATLLRVSDVMRLRKADVYTEDGRVKRNAFIKDKKTGKQNTLYLKPVRDDLLDYWQWLQDFQKSHPYNRIFDSEWLFPSYTRPDRHITENQYYKIIKRAGELAGVAHVGTHSMRKTGALIVYEQSNHNIGLVMKLLNHSSEAVTMDYLGLSQERRENILDTIDFDRFR